MQCPFRGQKIEIHSWAIRETKHGTPPAIRYLQSLAESRTKCLVLRYICRIVHTTETAANTLRVSYHNCRLLPKASRIVGQAGRRVGNNHITAKTLWKALTVLGAWSVQQLARLPRSTLRIGEALAIGSSHFPLSIWYISFVALASYDETCLVCHMIQPFCSVE